MSDPVSQELFFQVTTDMRREWDERHKTMRGDINHGFDRLALQLESHARDDKDVADRLLIVETQREAEKAEVVRRSTWMALTASAALTAGWQMVKHMMGWA